MVDAIGEGHDNEAPRLTSQAILIDCRPSSKRTTMLEAEATLSSLVTTHVAAARVGFVLALPEKLIGVVSDGTYVTWCLNATLSSREAVSLKQGCRSGIVTSARKVSRALVGGPFW